MFDRKEQLRTLALANLYAVLVSFALLSVGLLLMVRQTVQA